MEDLSASGVIVTTRSCACLTQTSYGSDMLVQVSKAIAQLNGFTYVKHFHIDMANLEPDVGMSEVGGVRSS